MLHRACRVGELSMLTNRDGKPSGGTYGFLKSLHAELLRHHSQSCVVVFDGGISKRRRELYPDYKGSRARDKSDPLYEEIVDPDKLAFRKSFNYQRASLNYILPRLNIPVVRLPGWEADDLIYRIAHKHPVAGTTVILSDDEDYFQMVRDWTSDTDPSVKYHVVLYRPMKGELITASNKSTILGFPGEEHQLRRAGIGDGSDKIKGIAGVGEKTMDDALLMYTGSLEYPFDDFILHCMSHPSKRVRKISDEYHIIHRNYELMLLDYEEYTDETYKRVSDQLQTASPNLHEAKEFLTDMDIFSIVKEFHIWVTPFQRLSKIDSK